MKKKLSEINKKYALVIDQLLDVRHPKKKRGRPKKIHSVINYVI
jgi:hypothetical protein